MGSLSIIFQNITFEKTCTPNPIVIYFLFSHCLSLVTNRKTLSVSIFLIIRFPIEYKKKAFQGKVKANFKKSYNFLKLVLFFDFYNNLRPLIVIYWYINLLLMALMHEKIDFLQKRPKNQCLQGYDNPLVL